MKCETAQQVFSDYLEEIIEKPLALTFERHLSQCEECRRAYGDFRSTWRALGSFPVVETPLGFRERVLARVQTQQETRPQEGTIRRLSLRSVFGARVPTRAFAWALSVLIFAVLLVKVSPGVFQSTLTGPLGGSWLMPAGPGMEVGVRTQVPVLGTDADAYQIILKPTIGAGQIEARLCRLENGKQFCKTQVFSGRETVALVLVEQPQAKSPGVVVSWTYSGGNFSKVIFLPRSQSVSEPPYLRMRNGPVDDALRAIASGYGAVISADAGLEGSVTLSGKFESAKVALDAVADQLDLEVRKEGPRGYRLERKPN
ncbi:MAG: hypothetical protein Q7T82_19270 [Armatimonadota bacterium]|nr:hypothetical protein [Armatimonadota bacterium]